MAVPTDRRSCPEAGGLRQCQPRHLHVFRLDPLLGAGVGRNAGLSERSRTRRPWCASMRPRHCKRTTHASPNSRFVVRQAPPRSADAIIGGRCLHRRCDAYSQRHDTQADGQRRRCCGRPRGCGRFLQGTRSGAGGRGASRGTLVDRLVGLDGVLSDIAMMRTRTPMAVLS
jgi:hypothetical protein